MNKKRRPVAAHLLFVFLVIGVNDGLRTQPIKRCIYLQSAWLSQAPLSCQALQLQKSVSLS
jgi:hypothetical protein